MPNLAEVHNWKENTVTQHLFKVLKEAKEETSRMVLSGNILYGEKSEIHYAKLVGYLEGLELVLTADLVTVEEE